MPKFLALVSLAILPVSLSAQIPTACLNLPAPTPQYRASIDAANHILEAAIKRDALDLDHIRKTTQKSAKQHPDDPFLLGALGNLQFRAGDLEASIAATNRSIQLFPCIAYVQFTAAKYYALIGDTVDAQQHLDTAYALNPNVPEIADEWRNTHTTQRQARTANSQQLQRHPATLSTTNGVEPFGDPPDQLLLPPATEKMVIDLHKAGPPSLGSFGSSHRSTITLMVNGKPMVLLLTFGDAGLDLTTAAAERAGISGIPVPRGKPRTVSVPSRTTSYSSPITGVSGINNSSMPVGRPISRAAYTVTISPSAAFRSTAAVQLGDIQSTNVPITVTSRPENIRDAPADWTDGSIGLYAFSRSLITLDIWNGVLTLAPLPAVPPTVSTASSGPHWTHFYLVPHGHQILVPVDIGSGSLRLFLLSIAASNSSVAPDTASHSPDYRGFTGFDGNYAINDIRVKIGSKVLAFAPSIRVEPRFPILGMGIYGTLARDALHGANLTFDYRDHLMQAH